MYKVRNFHAFLHCFCEGTEQIHIINIKATEKNLELVFDIDSSIPSTYFGDDKRIRQILLNLLTNAVKYTNQGQITLKVLCDTEGGNAILHYSVKDTGIGIKKEDIDKIYDEFQRVDLQRNRDVEGTGLGMTIVQQLLKLMGSQLEIQSEYEKGSEFSFDIAQKIINEEPVGDFRDRIFRATQRNEHLTAYFAPEAKILVVDDNEINLKIFKGLLKKTKMQIYEAKSGMECLDMLEKQDFDLVFLDYMMPGMDGIETLHVIRDRQMCAGVPIIMLTANAIAGDREKYIREGFDDFLTKPIIPDKLDEMILQYLSDRLIMVEDSVETVRQSLLQQEEKMIVEPESYQALIQKMLQERLPEIDFKKGLVTCSGDLDFYLELFQDFTELSIKDELIQYLSEEDYKNYSIRIHGFKNNAYSIGAIALGDLAYEMEKLSKNQCLKETGVLQDHLVSDYERICQQYHEVKKSILLKE